MTPHRKPKVFRDPVHDIISLDHHQPDGALLLALVDTRELQRLRRVRQLAMSHLVYHGAEHSRFSHSMGVMHLTRRMLDTLQTRTELQPRERLVTAAAALLHDVGHGPFSHALEAVTGVHHEERSVGIVLDPDTEVNAALRRVDSALPGEVAALLGGEEIGRRFLRQVVSGQLDADRLDYILRDGHATGVRIGNFDLARILALLDVDDDRLAVLSGAEEAVEGYLIARFHMYKQVYLHRASRAAERMLDTALRRAATLRASGHPLPYWPGGALGGLLEGVDVAHPDFARLDDTDVWLCLKRWCDSDDRALRDLSGGLVNRRLYKTLELPSDQPRRASEMVSAARSVARVKGFDPDCHVLVDSSANSPYRPFTGVETSHGGSIRIVEPSGKGAFIEDRSAVVKMLGVARHEQQILCVHPDLRDTLRRQLAL